MGMVAQRRASPIPQGVCRLHCPRTRIDFIKKDGGVVETKTGGSRLRPNQEKLRDDIQAGREVTPVGKNAEGAGLRPGVPTTLPSFDEDRPF